MRQAAQAALASEHPVRVVDGDTLVGVVDDEAILRVVVAEEAGVTATRDRPLRDPKPVEPDAASAGPPSASAVSRWIPARRAWSRSGS